MFSSLSLSSQLVKVPCIMVAMVGFQIATTPPNSPPSAAESASSISLEVILKQSIGRAAVKLICWTAALSEAAVIVANHIQEPSISRPILSSLVFRNSPDRIRPTPMFFFGTFLAVLGGYIRYKCYKEMGKMFTFEMSIRRDHQLVTSGPYSVVRHPGYTGILCCVAGFILWNLSSGSWARECGALMSKPGQLVFWTYSILVSTICVGLISRMYKEDEVLHGTFGEAWELWARDVPYKLIPVTRVISNHSTATVMALNTPGLSFPAFLHNPGLASRLAQIHAVASDEVHLTKPSIHPKSSRRDPYEGKRWVRRKDNAQFVGNPHIVEATKGDSTIQPPRIRPTFPEPLPPYLTRTAKLPAAQTPHTDPLSANAGRFSLSLKGMRKALRGSGNRAEVLVRQIENELTEWLWEGGTILNPDSVSHAAEDMDVQDLVRHAKPVQGLTTVVEVTRTPLQLIWYLADDAFARYIVHCCARYHEVVSYSKDVAGFRLTYLLRPNVTRPDRHAPTTLDTPPVTDVDYSSQPESDFDFLSDLSEKGTDSDVEPSRPPANAGAALAPVSDTSVPPVADHHSEDETLGDLSDLRDVDSEAGYVAVHLASLNLNSTDAEMEGKLFSDESGPPLLTMPQHPLRYSQSARRQVWSRSTSSPSRSPARTMARRRVTLVRRYETPKSTVTALGATRPQSFYDFLYS